MTLNKNKEIAPKQILSLGDTLLIICRIKKFGFNRSCEHRWKLKLKETHNSSRFTKLTSNKMILTPLSVYHSPTYHQQRVTMKNGHSLVALLEE